MEKAIKSLTLDGDRMREIAAHHGFPEIGFVNYDLSSKLYRSHVERFSWWINKGYSASMSYLSRRAEERADPRKYFPELQSVISFIFPYSVSPSVGGSGQESDPKYARYLNGEDYHLNMKRRLKNVMADYTSDETKIKSVICVDTCPVMERSWGNLCGLGWIGKNTMLIHPRIGSFFFIGVVYTNLRTKIGPNPLPDFCGHCSRCLDKCPTKAFPESGVLDSNKCISFQTLEKKELNTENREMGDATGPWIAGCDICQEVCPFNLKRMKGDVDKENWAKELSNSWTELLKESKEEYKSRVAHLALNYVKYDQMKRNILISLHSLCTNNISQFGKSELSDIKDMLEHGNNISGDGLNNSIRNECIELIKNYSNFAPDSTKE